MAINDNYLNHLFENGWMKVGDEVWTNELVQEYNTYHRFPGTPHFVAKVALPPCRECLAEVKPGEDLCWDCLGEQPLDDDITYSVISNNMVIHNATITPATYNPIVFTWDATVSASVTGLTVDLGGGTFSKTFAPITVVNGDSIQWTIRDLSIS